MALHSNLANVEEKEHIMADADKKVGLTADQEAQRLKSMNNEQVLKEIDAHFKSVEAYMDPKALEDSKIKMAEAVDQARKNDKNKGTYATQAAKVLTWEELAVAVTGDKNGTQNTTISGQKALGEVAGVNFWGGASGTSNNSFQAKSASGWVNEVFPDFKIGSVNILPVARQGVDYEFGGKFGFGNVTFTQGYIGNPEGTKLNWYQLLNVKGDGSAINTTANLSYDIQGSGKQLHSFDGGLTQNLMGKGTDLTFAYIGQDPDAIAKGVGVKGEARVFLNNVQDGKLDPAFMIKAGLLFGEGAQAEKATELATEVLKSIRNKPAQTPDYLSSTANAAATNSYKPSAPLKAELVSQADYQRHDETKAAAPTEKPVMMAQAASHKDPMQKFIEAYIDLQPYPDKQELFLNRTAGTIHRNTPNSNLDGIKDVLVDNAHNYEKSHQVVREM